MTPKRPAPETRAQPDGPPMHGPLMQDPAGDTLLAEPDGPRVLLEIDPALPVGFVRGRLDIALRGRVISEAAIAEVRLQVDERILAVAAFGQPEAAPVTALPDGTPARQRGFQFNLPCQPDDAVIQASFQLVARTTDDLECAEDFVIDIDTGAPVPATLAAGPARPLAQTGANRPHAVLYIERATIDLDGLLTLEGWAVAARPILAIHIHAGDTRLGTARLGIERDDVAAAYAAYPDARLAGFRFSAVLPNEVRNETRGAAFIRACLLCPYGFAQEEAVPLEYIAGRTLPPTLL
ncbi:MAG TPA: hypothetical protein VE690_19765, partial [Rhodopila sp.]|nr:hypothetical protein [Rhodopila sp.]